MKYILQTNKDSARNQRERKFPGSMTFVITDALIHRMQGILSSHTGSDHASRRESNGRHFISRFILTVWTRSMCNFIERQ